MSEPPLISVAMCTYNGEKYVEQQLRSILAQTYRNIEIVIVDDCSSDGTIAILEKLEDEDPRVTVRRNAANIGFVENFQRALRACTGDFIALADQDDIWLPEKLGTLLSEIGDNLLVYSRVELIGADGERIEGVFPRVNRIDGECALSLILDNCVTGHACLMRRVLLEAALPMPKKLLAHDQWLAIAAASAGRLKACSQVLSLYRMHGGNALLAKKGDRKHGKAAKSRQKIDRYEALISATLDSGFFQKKELQLLEDLLRLLKANKQVFYNRSLARFLRQHQDIFLKLYTRREKAIKKICRGYWYFLLLPFA